MTGNVVDINKLWTVFKNNGKDAVIHKDLDLTIQHGDMLSLVGGSGTGKTVLLRQMLGLEHPTQGEITVLGKPVMRSMPTVCQGVVGITNGVKGARRLRRSTLFC